MSDVLLTDNTLFDKLDTHKKGLKHYAFSVFLFNIKGEFLLQKRATNKYHSGGLWSNTCCSHFRNVDEFNNKEKTAKNRLQEELGVDFKGSLNFVDVFEYNEKVNNGLIENEVDYIFTGLIDDDIVAIREKINKNEAEDVDFIDLEGLKYDINNNSHKYTKWFYLMMNDKSLLKKITKSLQ